MGTDPADAVNFDLPVYKEDDSTVSFAAAIGQLLEGLQEPAKKSMAAENQALVGQKDFDPAYIGFELDPQKIAPGKDREPFELDTSIPGNHNTGHEFGAELSEDDRWALIEYLKIHVDPPAPAPMNKR